MATYAWPYPTEPFFTGDTVGEVELGAGWDVAINGHRYLLDRQDSRPVREYTVPITRTQGDASDTPGEQSVNPEDLWRRSREDWSGGAGQVYADRTASSTRRYRTSKGIDPWTQGRLSLLPDTSRALASANTNLPLAVAGDYIYCLDGNTLKFTAALAAPSTWTNNTGTAGTGRAVASDGYRVYLSTATDTYYATRGTAAMTALFSVAVPSTLVRVAKGRLFVIINNAVYMPTALGAALGAAWFTHGVSDWTWTDVTEGPNAVYLAGYTGDKSRIYRTEVTPDGTALASPTVAGELPDGEIVYAICGYLGYLMIGTSKGVRFAVPDSNGNLGEIGALISTSSPVKCFEPQDRFIWYGLSSYDASSSGLGRVDLRTFNGTAPAWASDLMASAAADVPSAATFSSKRVFSVAGNGVYWENANKVASGTLTTGWFGYGLTERKTIAEVNVRWLDGAGTVGLGIASDYGASVEIDTVTASGVASGNTFDANNRRAELAELTLTLTRADSDATDGPCISRWTMRADPGVSGTYKVDLPLLLHRQVQLPTGATHHVDVAAEMDFFRSIRTDRSVVSIQRPGAATVRGIVDDYEFSAYRGEGGQTDDGTILVVVKILN